MIDIGPLKNSLGLEIDYCQQNSKINISQKHFMESLAKKFQILEAKSFQTLMETNLRLLPEESDNLAEN